MATYNLQLRNPYSTATTFKIKFNAGITNIALAPFETKLLTDFHADFVITADSATDVTVGQKISEFFMSGNGPLEILMKEHVRQRDKVVRIRNKPYTEFFQLIS